MTADARRRREGGFTLLEILGAAVVMAVGLLAMVNAMNFAYRMQTRALGTSEEWTVFQAMMDSVLGAPFTAFATTGGGCTTDPIRPGTNCNGYVHPTIGGLLTQTWPDDDEAYGDWSYYITVTNLDPGGYGSGGAGVPVQSGDGKIIRRVDVCLENTGSNAFSDTFSIVVVDKDDLVP